MTLSTACTAQTGQATTPAASSPAKPTQPAVAPCDPTGENPYKPCPKKIPSPAELASSAQEAAATLPKRLEQLKARTLKDLKFVEGGTFTMGDFGPLVGDKLPLTTEKNDDFLREIPQLLGTLLQASQNTQITSDLDIKSASGAHNTGASSYENNSESTDNAAVDTLPLETNALLAQAQALGYANQAELISARVPWRPQQIETGSSNLLGALTGAATAPGAQTALVVGPNGSESDLSAGDVYTDSLGRIRIRLL